MQDRTFEGRISFLQRLSFPFMWEVPSLANPSAVVRIATKFATLMRIKPKESRNAWFISLISFRSLLSIDIYIYIHHSCSRLFIVLLISYFIHNEKPNTVRIMLSSSHPFDKNMAYKKEGGRGLRARQSTLVKKIMKTAKNDTFYLTIVKNRQISAF